MPTPILHVDAFADRPFAGNPAAVCVLERAASAAWMQNVALEMNLSETAFLHPEDGAWKLRWFTPTVEVALCGHATLASAHALWETGRLARDQVALFDTQSGRLTARRDGARIELDFPTKAVERADPPRGLLEALGVRATDVGRNEFDWLVEVEDERVVRGARPDHALLRKVEARGVIVTSRSSDARFDFVSRFFAPGSGIDEDPVTGSAHCALAPWWAAKLGRTRFVAHQASARGGTLWLELAGERWLELAGARVHLQGHAVTTLRGELLVEPT